MEGRKWEDMEMDCSVNVFSRVGLEALIFEVPLVCKSWCKCYLNPGCWQVLDFCFVYKKFFDTQPHRRWKDLDLGFSSDKQPSKSMVLFFTNLLKFAVNRSNGCAVILVFPHADVAKLEHLEYVSQEYPNLKMLFFPNLEEDEDMQVPKLFCKGMKLERLCMRAPRSSFKSILTEINRHYDNFVGLKLIYRTLFSFDAGNIVNTMSMSLPFLKRLELYNFIFQKGGLIKLLEGCEVLENLFMEGCIFYVNEGST